MDSEGIDNQHDTTYGLSGESANSSADGQNAFQDELDMIKLFLLGEEGEEQEEEQIPLKTMLDILSSDIQSEKQDSGGDGDQSEKQDSEGDGDQSEKQDSGGDGDQSGKRKQKCSEAGDNDSAVVEGDGDGGQSTGKQKRKCSEKIGSSSEVVEGESSSQVKRLVLSPGSESQGVTYQKNTKYWEAHIWIKEVLLPKRKKNGFQLFLGNHRTENEAKHAHDRVAIKLDIRETQQGKPYTLNFPESAQAAFLAEHQDWTDRDFVWRIRRSAPKFSRGRSDMKGVTVRPSARKRLNTGEEESGPQRYSAKISQKIGEGEGQMIKKSANLGTYASAEEAGKAYDRALLFINNAKEDELVWNIITNFRPSTYPIAEIQEAGSKLVFK